jgi:energy-coupling factor transporter ATP-binding protein EcfA2
MDRSSLLVGLEREFQRLTVALRQHQSLLVLGPSGSGKTALITAVLKDQSGREIISIQHPLNLHDLLVNLARSLLDTGHSAFRRLARPGNDAEKWLAQQSSVHLKGLLWAALEAEPRAIVIDGVVACGFPMYRFLQRLYFTKGTALVVSARDPITLGITSRLFWDPRNTIHLRPLNARDARSLFDSAVARFGIGHLDIEEFRGKALTAAKGNPGQLIEMCRLASNPMYVTGLHIKFVPLWIDVRMKFIG